MIRIEPHPQLRTVAGGTCLIGGSPVTLLRLSETGAELTKRWFSGEPVADTPGHLALAERLIDRNMASVTTTEQTSRSITVVLPVLNDLAGLQHTLTGLAGAELEIVIVDDGSTPPIEQDDVPGAVLVRHERPRGPAAARNAGARHRLAADADVLVFIDASVVIDGDAVRSLSDRIVGPVVAAAPRVRSRGTSTTIERYEAHSSPLDLGTIGGRVRPGREVSYVPTACVAIERAVFADLHGFDEAMRFGEDVDFVWRLLADPDREVEYVPSIEATHPARPNLRAFVKQRIGYGSAAGPLGVRHGSAVAPWRANGWSSAVAVVGIFLSPMLAVPLAAFAGERVAKALPEALPDRRAHAHRLALEGHLATVRGLASAASRPWWPLTAMLALVGVGRIRRGAVLLLIIQRLRALVSVGGSANDRLATVGLGCIDDAAYGTGVTLGSWRTKSPRPFMPSR